MFVYIIYGNFPVNANGVKWREIHSKKRRCIQAYKRWHTYSSGDTQTHKHCAKWVSKQVCTKPNMSYLRYRGEENTNKQSKQAY